MAKHDLTPPIATVEPQSDLHPDLSMESATSRHSASPASTMDTTDYDYLLPHQDTTSDLQTMVSKSSAATTMHRDSNRKSGAQYQEHSQNADGELSLVPQPEQPSGSLEAKQHEYESETLRPGRDFKEATQQEGTETPSPTKRNDVAQASAEPEEHPYGILTWAISPVEHTLFAKPDEWTVIVQLKQPRSQTVPFYIKFSPVIVLNRRPSVDGNCYEYDSLSITNRNLDNLSSEELKSVMRLSELPEIEDADVYPYTD
ncbi:hypothetical protein EJ08DRAFT_679697 [Tothia fuscella]|uniref:Uncharacterized protein n=1 Tax=Tothia fuscella TaxID=1048955 RepID=A0A9P4NPM6_9PEZI|nr:hypothetical protein EJ08DRAFT_679697 [Tothia fuscella]